MLARRCQYGLNCWRVSTRISNQLWSTPPQGRYLNTTPLHQANKDDHSEVAPAGSPQIIRYVSAREKYNHRQESKAVFLDEPSLGRPAEIVVVSDNPRRKIRSISDGQRRPKSERTFTRADSALILDEIDAGQLSKSDSEAPLLLDEIRAKHVPHTSTLTKEDWIQLRDEVERSFTLDQLSSYLLQYHKSPALGQSPEGQPDLSEATWKPYPSSQLVEDNSSEGASQGEESRTPDLKGKKLLADRILRDCWELTLLEENGQLQFHLPKHAITLLSRSSRRSFDKLAEIHQVEISVSKQSGYINIIGKKASCLAVHESIKDTVSRIGKYHFKSSIIDNLIGREGRGYKSKFIEWLSKSYAVALGEKNSATEDTIYFFKAYRERALKARRDLDLMTRYKSRNAVPFTTYLPASHEGSFYSADVEQSGTWFERRQKWARWSMPLAPKDIEEEPSSLFFDQQSPDIYSKILHLLQQPTGKGGESPVEDDVYETYTASIGKCLFLHRPNLAQTSASAAQLGELALPRIFVKDVPKAASFLSQLNPFPGATGRAFYKFRLIPSITNTGPLPVLEVEVEAKSDRSGDLQPSDLVLKKVKAIVEERSIDFLLPESSQDIRFTRAVFRNLYENSQTRSDAQIPSRFEDQTLANSIQRFLKNMPFRYHESGPQLLLPTFRKLTLTRRAIEPELSDGNQPSHVSQASADQVDEASACMEAKYCLPPVNDFGSTQVHYYDFFGERLSFNYCESRGIFAKSTTDLNLEMNILKDDQSDPLVRVGEDTLQQEFQSFYRTACTMAFDLSRK